MTVVEFIVMGYIINIIFLILYVLYAVIRALTSATPMEMIFDLGKNQGKKQKRRGAFWFPYAILLEIFILIKQEIDFKKSFPDGSYVEFMNTQYKD